MGIPMEMVDLKKNRNRKSNNAIFSDLESKLNLGEKLIWWPEWQMKNECLFTQIHSLVARDTCAGRFPFTQLLNWKSDNTRNVRL